LILLYIYIGIKSVDLDHAASHLGKAIGISTFLRSVPHNAQNRRVLVPQELMLKHGLSQEDLIRNKNRDKIKELTFEIATQANNHYEKVCS
jgi:NADH dehydrogenase [ubiquinone] 1 alpha subcomplex assembly factor 6